MISILLPSAGRPNLLAQCLQSLRDTTKEYDIEIIAVIDEDANCEKIAESFGADFIDWSQTRRGALWAWNQALLMSDGDILVPAGDDQIFHPHWLDFALESHKEKLNGYGVVGMNDLAYDGNKQLATMFLFDRAYCKADMGGIFAPPMYHYYNIDSEWNAKAKALGKFYWDARSVVEHVHSAHGKRPLDHLDQEKADAGWMEQDNKTFEERKANGFPITWEPLI
jgi:glycosyltransferase involved in cell wall biosynthesis